VGQGFGVKVIWSVMLWNKPDVLFMLWLSTGKLFWGTVYKLLSAAYRIYIGEAKT
jgi:hypothetical protein